MFIWPCLPLNNVTGEEGDCVHVFNTSVYIVFFFFSFPHRVTGSATTQQES